MDSIDCLIFDTLKYLRQTQVSKTNPKRKRQILSTSPINSGMDQELKFERYQLVNKKIYQFHESEQKLIMGNSTDAIQIKQI
jgi:hypothetical protein